ncbi:NAD kinase 2, mitochondrial isoform X2 [Arctopsyche grandis]|uniref:NAD kinase 2, mitochondrial isoform X2 n=2 Tax=Arctopsyche grandis TaxID=121162 RepID=UPI00406D6CF6
MNGVRELLKQIAHGPASSKARLDIFKRALHNEKPNIALDKCLLVSKVTRYEFEQNRHQGSSNTQIEELIRRRGSDYEALIHYHKMQKEFERRVQTVLTNLGADVKVVNRLTYSPSMIDWCDVVIPCGGDGTFLLAASKVRDSRKPVIGFNSDPSRSEGRLCLPKWCSHELKEALEAIKNGKFKWLHRSRIRTTLSSDERLRSGIPNIPIDLHKPILPRYNVCETNNNFSQNTEIANNSYGIEPLRESENPNRNDREEHIDRNNQPCIFKRVLPYLALNEVFIGENVSARVSHLQLTIDESSKPTRTKCSGLCVSTGTGSTSWHLSINCLLTQTVTELVNLWSERTGRAPPATEEAQLLTEDYNKGLIFPPDDNMLAYTVRELISGDVWPSQKDLRPRGFANNILVKSRCVDAGLVIDGGLSFPFNDGTEAFLEINPEDSLKTIALDE